MEKAASASDEATTHFELTVRVRMRKVGWDDVTAGDKVYYLTPRQKHTKLNPATPHGPFVVVDPAVRKLANLQGIRLALPANLVLWTLDEQLDI